MSRRLTIASLIWTAALLASRVLGLVRDAVLGATLGVGPEADVYAAAFRIPDLVSLVISGGALSIVFIPMFTGMVSRGESDRAWAAYSRVANLVVMAAMVVVPALWLAAPALTEWFVPGFAPEQKALLVRLSRIMLPAQLFHLLSGLLGAALLSREKHAIPALAPLVYNLAIIVGGWWFGSAEGFAWGVLVGSILGPFLLPLLACLQGGLRWELRFDFGHPDVRAYLAAAIPIMTAFGIVALDDYLWTFFASHLDSGYVATLNYAKTLMKVPIGVFGFAMGLAAYPTLSRLYAEGKPLEAWAVLRTALGRTLVLAFASQVGLTVAAPEIGTLVYGTTRIPPDRMAALALLLGFFSLSIAAWSSQTLLSRGFYARGRNWLPTRMGFGFMLLAIPIYWFGAEQFGAVGLACASALTITAYIVTLYAVLRRDVEVGEGVGGLVLRLMLATAVGLAVGFGVRALLPPFDWTRIGGLWRVAVLGVACGAAFVGTGLALGVPELRQVLDAVTRRFRRQPG